MNDANCCDALPTGDKVETAVNIGYACNLLHAEQQIFTVTSVDEHGENRVKEEMMSHVSKRAYGGSHYVVGAVLDVEAM